METRALVTAANLQTQDYKYGYDTATGRWSWTTRIDVSKAEPAYLILNIISPVGILRDTIPIPGEVIEAMADSIAQLQTQFPPEILIGPPSSLVFTLDQGAGFSADQSVTLTNSGVFGSLLGATLSTSASYVTVTPTQVGNLASQESGTFDVAADSTSLLSANSPYNESVTVEDPNAGNTPQVLPVTIIVRPLATIAATPTALVFNVVKPLTGDFPVIPSQNFSVENAGPTDSVLAWTLQSLTLPAWLSSFSPVEGSLTSGQTELVTVAVAPPASTLVGTYQDTLRISGYSSNLTLDVTLTLNVT